ncbi:hypothetical protein RIK65_08710 [Enterobacter asburiae]|uniref:hypothetical protein n=1 Tax=Enterobacter asburiae TaxID=61645 RepID=UPI00288BA032|nr:hypothetical protein [Enterobacter asburiae]WNI62534.1 hypothetical protein RIL73_18970 [Enterobacter asburiae]WNI69234.1 hypothetical protein RIK65_08710 [Enterobacter asburiae]
MKIHNSTFLCSVLMFTCLSSNMVLAQVMPPVLTKKDFAVKVKDQTFGLGDRWTPEIAHKIEMPVEGSFTGEIPFDGTYYKFFQHQRAGLEIFSSNLWWDKAERSVDDYIVSQITLTAEDFATPRGVHVGSTREELNHAYGNGQVDNDSGEQWITYELAKKALSFEMQGGNVVKITMNYDNGSSE